MTKTQLVHSKRKIRKIKKRRLALRRCPQKRATCTKIETMTPRKPNSAIRKVGRCVTTIKERIIAYIPGMSHKLQKHSVVLLRGGKTTDLPGLQYKMIRGKLDFERLMNRRKRRSIYGTRVSDHKTPQKPHPYKKMRLW
jgi:small subunit ribosomal protein S12